MKESIDFFYHRVSNCNVFQGTGTPGGATVNRMVGCELCNFVVDYFPRSLGSRSFPLRVFFLLLALALGTLARQKRRHLCLLVYGIQLLYTATRDYTGKRCTVRLQLCHLFFFFWRYQGTRYNVISHFLNYYYYKYGLTVCCLLIFYVKLVSIYWISSLAVPV